MDYTTHAAKAYTLKDLHDRIAEALEVLGDDAEWTGYSDGRLYFWPKDESLMLAVEVSCDEGGLSGNAKTGSKTTENNNSLP
jgi:hypothetical protein